MKYYVVLFVAGLFLGCEGKSKVEKEIAAIPMDIEIVRFDKIFGSASEADLPRLKQEYPQFFPIQYADSVWQERIRDTFQIGLTKAVANAFPSEDLIEDQLIPLFQHIKHYQPEFKMPQVYTAISDVDYRQKVIASEGVLVIGLDTYLGPEHEFYAGLPNYVAKNLKASQIGPDVAEAYARPLISVPRQRSLLSQMIYFGKELYMKNLWLPDTSDAETIGYTEAEFIWARDNEVDIWRYFIENELLYSTDAKLLPRFINPAPFSKFYLEIDNESPGMIGRYLGWQIVRAYMKNNAVGPKQLMIMDSEEIFQQSKYKPKK